MNGTTALWPRLALAGIFVLLVAGLAELFRARFATGDVYPEYSSLRGDPLGTRVYYEALEQAGVTVSRNFRDVAREDLGRGTIYLCGLSWSQMKLNDTDDAKALLESVRAGSRLVIGFVPAGGEDPVPFSPRATRERTSTKEDDTKPKKTATTLARAFVVDARWLPAGQDGRLEAVRVGEGPLPEKFLWHTALSFEPEGDSWRRIYDVGRYAGVIERAYGAGSIVLVGDAFVLSNEAMARARQSSLLAWLQGPHRRAVFDETHLGVEENAGIAALARRYGLAHTALALVAVALLYLWKNGSSLVPPPRGANGEAEELTGRDASSGLVNLLQRTLPDAELPAACLSEYKRGVHWRRLPPATQRSLEGIVLTRGGDRRRVLETLRAAHELLKRKT